MSARDLRQSLVRGGIRLPRLELPALEGDRPTVVPGPHRTSSVILILHPWTCDLCDAYLSALAHVEKAIEEWGGQVTIIHPDVASAAQPPSRLTVAIDRRAELRELLGVQDPAVVIIDEWREVHLAHQAPEGHDLPSADEILSWCRYLATRCPECEGEAL